MGNYLTSPSLDETKINDEIKQQIKQELDERIKTLQNAMDKNKDGTITHQELEEYVKNTLTLEQAKYEQQLRKETEEKNYWKEAYETLRLSQTINNKDENRIKQKENIVSTEALRDYIENTVMVNNNMKYVPDAIEKRIYLSIYKNVLTSVQSLFDTAGIEALNHRITFNIVPANKTDDKN